MMGALWAHFFLLWQICWFHVLLRAWLWDIVILWLFGILNIVWFGWKSLCDHVVLFVLVYFWIFWVIFELVDLCFRSGLCPQWNELGKRWCFLSVSAWTFMIMNLTLVSIDFSKQPNSNGWCQHKILGGEDQKSLNFKIDNKNLSFMQVRKETLMVAPLGVGLGDLAVGEPKVQMMLDLYFNFLAKTGKYSLDPICINFRF